MSEISLALLDVGREAKAAEAKYGPFTSSHEGLGVLVEEFDELKDAIRANSREDVQREAVHVSAVALRIAACCSLTAFRLRSSME